MKPKYTLAETDRMAELLFPKLVAMREGGDGAWIHKVNSQITLLTGWGNIAHVEGGDENLVTYQQHVTAVAAWMIKQARGTKGS